MNDLFADLVHHTHAVVDRHQEAHISCPSCGHVSTPKDPHCSFSERGWFCFVCGEGGSLQDLARRLDLGQRGGYTPPTWKPQEKEQQTYSWMVHGNALLARYTGRRDVFERWMGYKPLKRSTIVERQLGVGVLPASRCKHERLIVPVFDGTMLVGLRGRSLGCSCGKWLVAGGWDLDLVPLYHQDALRPGCVAWILENPVDALLLTERTPYIGLATYSTVYWRQAWTEALQALKPELVVVAFDNDLVGMGGDQNRELFIREWLKTHPRIPEPRGVVLANRLLEAGLPIVPYKWGKAPNKYDVGSLLMDTQGAIV